MMRIPVGLGGYRGRLTFRCAALLYICVFFFPKAAAISPNLYTGYDGLSYKHFTGAGAPNPGVSYSYDGLGRMVAATDLFGRSVNYEYSLSGVRSKTINPDGNYVQYTLDTANRVTSAGLNGTSNVMLGQVFDSPGRRTTLRRGTSSAGGATTYGYDAFGRLTSLSNDMSGTANDVAWTFTARNPANQITAWATTNDDYEYNEAATLTENRNFDGLNRDANLAALSCSSSVHSSLPASVMPVLYMGRWMFRFPRRPRSIPRSNAIVTLIDWMKRRYR